MGGGGRRGQGERAEDGGPSLKKSTAADRRHVRVRVRHGCGLPRYDSGVHELRLRQIWSKLIDAVDIRKLMSGQNATAEDKGTWWGTENPKTRTQSEQ
ncbi:hypothetical protein GCM10017557_14570 [Streptomyces aurantiacus]|uniref:Uncharacterized protein n=1 Tax=Streptomyces aurantiacus TaxID=47760 RepID=A0A7G1NTY1_9ACTN|nr:hypothetical protein GCM10017557_14570 [Streptomyces aurantiacus]